MIGRILGAVVGREVGRNARRGGGAKGALLGALSVGAMRRLGPLGWVLGGAYVAKKAYDGHKERQGERRGGARAPRP